MPKQKIEHRPVRHEREHATGIPSPPSGPKEQTRSAPEPIRATPEILVHPCDLGPLLTHRPLVLGEEEAGYNELLANVTGAIKPQDFIETMWVKDVVDEMWEAQRYRRLKVALLRIAAKDHLVRTLKTAKDPVTEKPLPSGSAELTAICCLQGDEESIEEVKDILTNYALDLDSIMARALADQLETIERIDRLIARADARRDKALSSVDRRRETFARQLRRVADDLAIHPDP